MTATPPPADDAALRAAFSRGVFFHALGGKLKGIEPKAASDFTRTLQKRLGVSAKPKTMADLAAALAPEAPLPPLSCRGPAKLCAALAIDRRHNGYILHKRDPSALQAAEPAAQRPPGEAKTESSLDSCLWLAPGEPVAEDAVARGPRIGVAYAGEDALLPYRLCIRGHAHLSRPV